MTRKPRCNAGITGDGKILLQMGEHKEIVAFASETEILKGLLRLLNPGSNVVYFLTGHGERDIEQSGETSMTRAQDHTGKQELHSKDTQPSGGESNPGRCQCDRDRRAGKPVSENEVKLLKEYLANGGSLIVMEDPTVLTEFGDESDPLADMLAQDWGITLQ